MKSFFFSQYLITDPIEYGDDIYSLEKNLSNSFQNYNIDMICFRDKISTSIEDLAKRTIEISRKFNINKVLINSNIDLAIKLKFDGVHLKSNQFDDIKYAKENNLYVIISCHNKIDIEKAKSLKCDAVTYSPIFYKKDKGKPKGLDDLSKMVEIYQDEYFKIIALGGIISNFQVEQIKTTKVSGFASIRYFKNDCNCIDTKV
ncbi:MAG: thiamine phosphate synthase [Campylobacterota bacterium]|nr:thiamine phosphate synthase [Campylobacterota bacterium]